MADQFDDYVNDAQWQIDYEESYIYHVVSDAADLMITHGSSYILNMIYDEFYKKLEHLNDKKTEEQSK